MNAAARNVHGSLVDARRCPARSPDVGDGRNRAPVPLAFFQRPPVETLRAVQQVLHYQGAQVPLARVHPEDVHGSKERVLGRRRRALSPRGAVDGLEMGQHESVRLGAIILLDCQEVARDALALHSVSDAFWRGAPSIEGDR
eukprot:508920-Pyramimonas_sp.AAC.1